MCTLPCAGVGVGGHASGVPFVQLELACGSVATTHDVKSRSPEVAHGLRCNFSVTIGWLSMEVRRGRSFYRGKQGRSQPLVVFLKRRARNCARSEEHTSEVQSPCNLV